MQQQTVQVCAASAARFIEGDRRAVATVRLSMFVAQHVVSSSLNVQHCLYLLP